VGDAIELSSRYGMRTEDFSTLMQRRVREILLVASHYDAFVLEEDGQLTELIFEEYRNLDLNLRYAPRFTRATTAAQAIELVRSRPFDLVVTTPRLPDAKIQDLVHQVRQEKASLPMGLLAAHAWDLPWLDELRDSGEIDWVFLWQGNVKALMAMIKQVEDRQNAEHDILEGGVQAIILVEDDVRFYSSYLPHIYTEVTQQTSRLMAEGVNLSHRLLRIRARPKILLAKTYEEALELYERYAGNLLGIITDMSYPRGGKLDPEAGLELAAKIRQRDQSLSLLVQSMNQSLEPKARALNASFMCKSSPTLLEELRLYILDNFGFGDFIFKLPDGEVIARASDLRELLEVLATVPVASVHYHASQNHFSAWLKARTEFELASLIRPRKASEFASHEELRQYLITTFTNYLREIQSHVIADFDGASFEESVAFAKIGSGSLGGKGRGLAFMHKLLATEQHGLAGVTVAVPQTVVVASDIFEEFLETNELRSLSQEADVLSDQQILDRCQGARLPHTVRADLASYLKTMHDPLAVRSSSLLEDSVYQPFAGVYYTIMLPNTHPSLDVRLAQLLEAIKVVYASTYFQQARDYLATTPYRIEEELMAVLVQRLVGTGHGQRFYPTFSGVASSYNFYPFNEMKPTDGVAQLVLGLGKSIVDGFEAFRFCPRHPQVLPQFSVIKDVLRNAQRRFYALDMSRDDMIPRMRKDANLVHLDVKEAINEGAADAISSTYDRANDRIVSGVDRTGASLITFAPLLKGHILPLPELLGELLESCERGVASPVEIEFAANVLPGMMAQQVFHVVQLRPMVVEKVDTEIQLDPALVSDALVRSEVTLGHGRRETIADIIVVDPRQLDRATTTEAACVIERWNRALVGEERQCILIGPGRWGSQDPWLGIPVAWSQISTARAIVETDFADLKVEPSLGSHFFHNLTCFGIAFFAIHQLSGGGWVNWQWFDAQPVVDEAMDGVIRHLRLANPVQVLVDGSSSRGVIIKGASSAVPTQG